MLLKYFTFRSLIRVSIKPSVRNSCIPLSTPPLPVSGVSPARMTGRKNTFKDFFYSSDMVSRLPISLKENICPNLRDDALQFVISESVHVVAKRQISDSDRHKHFWWRERETRQFPCQNLPPNDEKQIPTRSYRQ